MESSLGPIPFALVKEYMLEEPYVLDDAKKDEIADLYFMSDQLEALDMANTDGPDNEKEKKVVDKEIQYAKNEVNSVIRRIDDRYKFMDNDKIMDEIYETSNDKELYNRPQYFYELGFDVDIVDDEKYADVGGLRIEAVYNSMAEDMKKSLNPYVEQFLSDGKPERVKEMVKARDDLKLVQKPVEVQEPLPREFQKLTIKIPKERARRAEAFARRVQEEQLQAEERPKEFV